MILRACVLAALILFPPNELLAPQKLSPKVLLALEYSWILDSIYTANDETVSFRDYMGQKVTPIPDARAGDLAKFLQGQARKNPDLFYQAWFPTLWTGAGFWNGRNDRGLRRSKQTHGYSELQVGTARHVSLVTGHTIPSGWGPAESFLVNKWRANLVMGNTHMDDLLIEFGNDPIKAMNAYAAGKTGTKKGAWVVTKRQKKIQAKCVSFQRLLEKFG